MLKIENYIGGELSQACFGRISRQFQSGDGRSLFSLIPDSDETDVEAAVEAAKKAFPVWSKMSAEAATRSF